LGYDIRQDLYNVYKYSIALELNLCPYEYESIAYQPTMTKYENSYCTFDISDVY